MEDYIISICFYGDGFTTIPDKAITIIKHARKSLFFDGNDIWIKNQNNPMFDVSMGSYDGAEV